MRRTRIMEMHTNPFPKLLAPLDVSGIESSEYILFNLIFYFCPGVKYKLKTIFMYKIIYLLRESIPGSKKKKK